jgi:hypothetical protein
MVSRVTPPSETLNESIEPVVSLTAERKKVSVYSTPTTVAKVWLSVELPLLG